MSVNVAIYVDNFCAWRATFVDKPRQLVGLSTIFAAAIIWSIPENLRPYATALLLMDVVVSGKFKTTGKSTVGDDPALFVDDRELHRRVAPHIGRDAFRAAIRVLETKNFPRTCPLFRGPLSPGRESFF